MLEELRRTEQDDRQLGLGEHWRPPHARTGA
jgi:hypothetical protein